MQRRYGGTPRATGEALLDSAARGVDGASVALPHLDTIQPAFGCFDVSGVEAHVDGAARQATAEIGAEAYATGEHVAFAGTPSLHTAAHEAAHVVQQRAGVQLAGGVGVPGDRYEANADAVADAVVAGRSAESLLGELAPGPRRPALQLRRDPIDPNVPDGDLDPTGGAASPTRSPAGDEPGPSVGEPGGDVAGDQGQGEGADGSVASDGQPAAADSLTEVIGKDALGQKIDELIVDVGDWMAQIDDGLAAVIDEVARRRAGNTDQKSGKEAFKKLHKTAVKPLYKEYKKLVKKGADPGEIEAKLAELVVAETEVLREEFAGLAETTSTPIRKRYPGARRKALHKQIKKKYPKKADEQLAFENEIYAQAVGFQATFTDETLPEYRDWFAMSIRAQADFDLSALGTGYKKAGYGGYDYKTVKSLSGGLEGEVFKSKPTKTKWDVSGDVGWHPGVCACLDAVDHEFTAKTYTDHSLGPLSVDLYPKSFSDNADVVELLLALDRAASATGCAWNGLYNVIEVAEQVNATLGKRYIGFQYGHDQKGGLAHLHVDIVPADFENHGKTDGDAGAEVGPDQPLP